MNFLRALLTFLIALFMIKLFIDLVMFLFVGGAVAEKHVMHGNLRS